MKQFLRLDAFIFLISSIIVGLLVAWQVDNTWNEPCDCSVDTAAMNAYADSILRVHWTEVCRDSMNKWDSINKLYER